MTEEDKVFIRDVAYFWEDKGDPTRFSGWDEARAERLMPAFVLVWKQFKGAREACDRIAKSHLSDTW
jgi:hypothetical protein